ncbi:NYN domain-containing protein [Nocardiopsis listeri]|uniref:NYN domain-containing protein n=1 Tax=Nocardiopsis listeri TaxID=53440 RepID=UPI00083014B8|nr:NYN domain-containing protein [Nocardiopsis listeri]
MDRCALFVDAGYLLADGAMAVHGTRNRDSVAWDYSGLVQFLNEVARDRTGLPLLRCYWYEAVADDRRAQEQDGIADIPGIKFRAAKIRPGRREGVESYVQRDLTTLARTGVLCDAVLVSGDEDMAPVVADVQDLGVRVTVVHISVEGNWTISRALRQECDDLIEIGAGHLRPHVNLLSGGGSTQENAAKTTTPFSNGRSQASAEQPRPAAPGPRNGVAEPANPSTGGLEAMFAGTGGQPVPQGSAMEQLRAMRRSLAQQRGDHLAGPSGENTPPGAIDANGFPSGGQAVNGNGVYPGAGQNGQAGYVGPHTGAHPAPRGAEGGYGLPTRPGPAQAAGGGPHGFEGTGPQQAFSNTGPQPAFGAGTGPQASFAPDPQQAPPHRNPQAPDPRFGGGHGEEQGFGGGADTNPTYGTSTATDTAHSGGAAPPFGERRPTGPEYDGRFGPGGYQESARSPGYTQQTGLDAHTVDGAVHVAHKEGNDFAESIAREAPVLWVEAVLARRPRMPSDLEARLLQGSSLPIDHLLRDEVRDGLRQGFWQALERARP